MNRFGKSSTWSVVVAVGLVLVYVGERLIGSGGGRGLLTGLGLALLVGALAVRLLRWRSASGETRAAEGVLAALAGVALVAVLLYLLQSDLTASWFAEPLAQKSPRFATALSALWPALLLAAVLPLLLVELAYAAMARAPVIEGGRIREALFSGLGLAFATIFCFAVVYVSGQRDVKWDLSYFRTARPGTATQNLVASLDEPLDVYLFFPPANDVREELKSYFDVLGQQSPKLKVHDLDQAVELSRARELGVSQNGVVVISRGARREQLQFGQRLEQARTQLKNLDRDAQKAILKIAKSKRTVYLITGHGERGETKAGPTDTRSTIAMLRELLIAQNYELRPLGPAEGLAVDVPQDAAAAILIGPTREPMPEEVAALSRYLARGGRLFLALDPDANVKLAELLGPLGLQFDTFTVANDQSFIARRHTAADKAWILTSSYSSHPAVTTLSQNGSRMPMGLLDAGALETTKDRPPNVSVDFTVHAHPATWNDLDGNYTFNPPAETRKSWELAAAITLRPKSDAKPGLGVTPDSKPEEQGRMVVLADSDALSDAVIQNPGNAYFLLDGLRWLFGEEALAGETTSEVDVPVEHTRKQDVAWFYSTVFLVPAAILGVGYLATRRRRKPARVTTSATEASR